MSSADGLSESRKSPGSAATLILPRVLKFIKFLFKIPISTKTKEGGRVGSPVLTSERAASGNQTLCWSLSRRDQYHIRAQRNT